MSNKDKNTLDLNAELEERRIVPLMLPDDFDTPRDLDERIIREMAQLSRELDEKNRQREERKAHAKHFLIRVAATAAVLATIVFVTPLRNYAVSASDDVKSWIKDISSESNNKIHDSQSVKNNDNSFENYYIINDKDFKGGIAHGDTLCIIPNRGEKDSVPIVNKHRLITNTWGEPGRDYFKVWITDSNRIWISVDKRVQKHAHVEVTISYEDGSEYFNEWDLITSLPYVRFSSHTSSGVSYEKGYVGQSFIPKYYVVVLDMKTDENGDQKEVVKTVNYLKGSNRIKWSSTDDSIASVDNNGAITGHKAGYIMINADTGLGNVTPINIQIAEKKKE